jgi:hypothetical protein
LFTLLIVFFFCTVGACSGLLMYLAADARQQPREITGTDLDGQPLSLDAYRGKIVLLIFWADDNPDDRATAARCRELQARFADQPFAVVGVCGCATRGYAKLVAEREGHTYRSFFDRRGGPIAREFQVRRRPTYLLLAADGSLGQGYTGPLRVELVAEEVERMLTEMRGN